jgi:hypothetical protein
MRAEALGPHMCHEAATEILFPDGRIRFRRATAGMSLPRGVDARKCRGLQDLQGATGFCVGVASALHLVRNTSDPGRGRLMPGCRKSALRVLDRDDLFFHGRGDA